MLTRLSQTCGKRAPAAAATLCQNPTLKGAFLYQRPGLRSRSFFDSKRLGCTAWRARKNDWALSGKPCRAGCPARTHRDCRRPTDYLRTGECTPAWPTLFLVLIPGFLLFSLQVSPKTASFLEELLKHPPVNSLQVLKKCFQYFIA